MIHNFDKHLEDYNNFETEYLRIFYYDLAKNHRETYRSYQYNRLCTIVSGKKHIKINDKIQYDYDHSEFILLPPNSSVDMEITEDTIAVVYEISDKLIEDTKNRVQINCQSDLDQSKSNILKEKVCQIIDSPIQRINHYCLSNDQNKSFLIDLCSQELTYNLIQNFLLPVQPAEKHMDPADYAMNYLRENVAKSVAVNEIAANLNMSASNLIVHFKKKTGMTPKDYHNYLKLKKSKEDLKHKNVSEVCYDLGFENISYFIKLFKDRYGETPKQYAMRISQRD